MVVATCLSALFSTTINATAWKQRSCVIIGNAAGSRKSRHWTKRLRRGMGGAGWVVAQDGRDLTVERVGCDTLGFPAVVAGDLWPPRTKGYHDVRTEKPSDPGHAARRAG